MRLLTLSPHFVVLVKPIDHARMSSAVISPAKVTFGDALSGSWSCIATRTHSVPAQNVFHVPAVAGSAV